MALPGLASVFETSDTDKDQMSELPPQAARVPMAMAPIKVCQIFMVRVSTCSCRIVAEWGRSRAQLRTVLASAALISASLSAASR